MSILEKVLVNAKSVSKEENEEVSKRLEIVFTEIKMTSELLSNLFGVEKEAKDKLNQRLVTLKQEQETLQCSLVLNQYHLLSFEPLKWRDENGLPYLIPFNLDTPDFIIAVMAYWVDVHWMFQSKDLRFEEGMSPQLPTIVTDCYRDVRKKIMGIAQKRGKTVRLHCHFGDFLIPHPIKEKIAEATKSGVFEKIFLIAETENLTLEEKEPSVISSDPLVVGIKGDKIWLIADFEVTSIESEMFFCKGGL